MLYNGLNLELYTHLLNSRCGLNWKYFFFHMYILPKILRVLLGKSFTGQISTSALVKIPKQLIPVTEFKTSLRLYLTKSSKKHHTGFFIGFGVVLGFFCPRARAHWLTAVSSISKPGYLPAPTFTLSKPSTPQLLQRRKLIEQLMLNGISEVTLSCSIRAIQSRVPRPTPRWLLSISRQTVSLSFSTAPFREFTVLNLRS